MNQFWRSLYPLLWFVLLDFDFSLTEVSVAEESLAIGLPLAPALLLEAKSLNLEGLNLVLSWISSATCHFLYVKLFIWLNYGSLAFAISADTYGPADRAVCVCLRFVGDSGTCRKKWVELAALYGVQGSAKSLSVGIARQLLSVTSWCSEL